MRKHLVLPGLLTVLIVGILALSGCSDPQAAQRERLDDAIHDVESALGRYFTVDPQDPAREFDRVTERVSSAWEAVREEAAGLDDIEIAAADSALDELVRVTGELSDDLTAREGLGILESFIGAFDEEVDGIHDALDAH